jgi:hypothetical protein
VEKISGTLTYEFKYDSQEERERHVKNMEGMGFECTGQIKRSDDSLLSEARNYYWYAKFIKYGINE